MAKQWRGLAAEVAKLIASGQIPNTASRQEIKEEMERRHPNRGPMSSSTLGTLTRNLANANVLLPLPTPIPATTPYEGFLFDGDVLIVTIGDKTWQFTRAEFKKVARMFSTLHKWTE